MQLRSQGLSSSCFRGRNGDPGKELVSTTYKNCAIYQMLLLRVICMGRGPWVVVVFDINIMIFQNYCDIISRKLRYLAFIYVHDLRRSHKTHVHVGISSLSRIGYWLRGHEGERNNYCFSKIQVVAVKNIETRHLSLGKAIQLPSFWFSKSGLFTTSGL